jgi:hypothetical protein
MKDIEELVKELDSQDMVGYTRKFIDDFELAISNEIKIDEDKDWSLYDECSFLCFRKINRNHPHQ